MTRPRLLVAPGLALGLAITIWLGRQFLIPSSPPPIVTDGARAEVTPSTTAAQKSEVVGIGVALDIDAGRAVIRAKIPGSPADGLRSLAVGDRILAVAENGTAATSVENHSLEQVVRTIRGPSGSVVRLTVLSPGAPEADARVVSIVRGKLALPTRFGDGALLPPGTTAPDFAFTYLTNNSTGQLQDSKGKLIVLDFWASWCGSCLKGLDHWEAIVARHPEWQDRVFFVAVSVDEDRTAAGEAAGARWPHLNPVWAGPDVLKPYHIESLPTVYLIGPDQRVMHAGALADLEIAIESQINRSQHPEAGK